MLLKTELHEPYELTLMDLKELDAVVRKDEDDRFYADIKNPKYRFNPKFHNPHLKGMEELRIVLKLNLFNFKLEEKSIRYCKSCNHNLILDERKFIDICETCMKEDK